MLAVPAFGGVPLFASDLPPSAPPPVPPAPFAGFALSPLPPAPPPPPRVTAEPVIELAVPFPPAPPTD